jgi:hypothetical protein
VNTKVETLLKRLESQRFFGELRLQYQRGELVLVRVEQTFKPHENLTPAQMMEDNSNGNYVR